MKNVFRRLSFPVKLMLISIVPLAFVIYLAIELQSEKQERINVLDNFLEQINQSANVGKIVNELQAERRMSYARFFSSGREGQMLHQRVKTDEALQNNYLNKNHQDVDFFKYTFLDSLNHVRKAIDNGALEPNEIFEYYSNCVARLNSLVNTPNSEVSYLKKLNQKLTSSKWITEMILNLAVIRTNIYFQLNNEIRPTKSLREIRYNFELFKNLEDEFSKKSSYSDDSLRNLVTDRPEYKQTIDYLNRTFESKKYLSEYEAEEWWDMTEVVVESFRTLHSIILEDITKQTGNLYNAELRERNQNFIILIAVIVVVILIVVFTIRDVSNTLTNLQKAANNLALGKTGATIQMHSNDIIGDLAKSISKIEYHNVVLSDAAGEIGKGNFDVMVTPRSSDDKIGNAILKMKNDLHKFNKESKEKIWITTGITKINSATRGEKKLPDLTADTLQKIADYLGVHTGLFYVSNESKELVYYAGTAVSNMSEVPTIIPFGENLIGQAALQKEIKVLTSIPPNYSIISSASGQASPKMIVIVPLVHEGKTEGVIELASLHELEDSAFKMLDQLSHSIAIALFTCKNRMRLQELLEETQSLAEEMQAQHAELENMNAELEVQAEKLQASEEELKVQQEELIQSNRELSERSEMLEEKNKLIEEHSKTIQKKAQELSQITKYKSEFLANMSHELRTPLNSILLLSRLLADNDEDNLTGEQVEFAKVIQSSGHGLLSLIDEILDLSKIEAGKMELEFTTIAVSEIISDIKDLFSQVAKQKNLDLFFDVDDDVPNTIETDKTRLEQVLKNFYSNALKFTSAGSIRMHISLSSTSNRFISFSVSDTGIGIPHDKQKHIFEAFTQADGSTQRKYGGTGLGLSISRELTRLLGGEISLSSKINEGSTFTATIPISEKDVAPQVNNLQDIQEIISNDVEIKHPVPGASTLNEIESIYPAALPDDRNNINHGDKVILIIDDDIPFAKSLISFTQKNGYKAIVAIQGDEGVALAQKFKPAGILLDIQLPGKNGWQVMDTLKENPATRNIPVHTMSSNMEKNKSLSKGAVDFINKPLSPEKIDGIFKKLEFVLQRNHKKVLIVEENEQHAKALGYYLETFNLPTVIHSDVESGVNTLLHESASCVILNMGIQDAESYNTLEEVKRRPGLENLNIIIFTSKSLSRSEEHYIKQYADSIVVKSAHSYQRILDEVSLFMNVVEESKGRTDVTNTTAKLGKMTEILKDKVVLVADDDVRNIFGLTKSLEKYKMKVVTAMDGKEALAALEQNNDIHIVLMDMMMPELDGYQTIKQIRNNKKYKTLPIIAVTAKAMKGDREKCINAGASDYITKPVDTDQLISLLRVWLYQN